MIIWECSYFSRIYCFSLVCPRPRKTREQTSSHPDVIHLREILVDTGMLYSIIDSKVCCLLLWWEQQEEALPFSSSSSNGVKQQQHQQVTRRRSEMRQDKNNAKPQQRRSLSSLPYFVSSPLVQPYHRHSNAVFSCLRSLHPHAPPRHL